MKMLALVLVGMLLGMDDETFDGKDGNIRSSVTDARKKQIAGSRKDVILSPRNENKDLEIEMKRMSDLLIDKVEKIEMEEIHLDLSEIVKVEKLQRKSTTRDISQSNKDFVKSVLEQSEIGSFGVIKEDGELEKDPPVEGKEQANRFEIDDIGFRLTIRNVQDIDDENGIFETSFNVHLAWFDFKIFESIWNSGDNGLIYSDEDIYPEVGIKQTTRIAIDLWKNDISQDTFGQNLPKIHFKKNIEGPPEPMTCYLKMFVIKPSNGDVATGYFSIGYEYTAVKFRQVILQENVPWDWQKFEYKFSLAPNLRGPDFRPFWEFDDRGNIVIGRSRFAVTMMKTPVEERSLLTLIKERFSKIKTKMRSFFNIKVHPEKGSRNRVAGFYNELLLSERDGKLKDVEAQCKAIQECEYMQIKSDQLREWNLYGYTYKEEQGMLAVDYKPNGLEDENFVYFWAKRDPVEALEGVKELFLYSMIASSSWLMNPFSWDLASAWYGFGIAVLFVMTPVMAYRSGFQRTYVKTFFFLQKFLVTVEVITQIVGRAPHFHCAELGGHVGEGIQVHIASLCLTKQRMLPYMITIIVLKFLVFAWFYLSKYLHRIPPDCFVYYRTDKQQFERETKKCDGNVLN